MTRLSTVLALGVVGLVVLVVAGPTLSALVDQLVPLVVTVGVVAALFRLVWFYTRTW